MNIYSIVYSIDMQESENYWKASEDLDRMRTMTGEQKIEYYLVCTEIGKKSVKATLDAYTIEELDQIDINWS